MPQPPSASRMGSRSRAHAVSSYTHELAGGGGQFAAVDDVAALQLAQPVSDQVGARVHLSLDHLGAVDVTFGGAGAVGRVSPAESSRNPVAKPHGSLTGVAGSERLADRDKHHWRPLN
jgi:hypothetical protein